MLKVSKPNDKVSSYIKNLVLSPRWPEAVPPDQICPPHSELEKSRRAEGVVEIMIEMSPKDCRVLDLGCGEGHTTLEIAKHQPFLSVGFDPYIQGSFEWERQTDNWILTQDWYKVQENGPYDILLVYDVIDHLDSKEAAIELMNKAHGVMAKNGRAFVRCHPWISRHGGHLYQQLNKAWAHMLLNDEELSSLIPNYKNPNIMKLMNPSDEYQEIFKTAGWYIRYKNQMHGQLENFFRNDPEIAKRIEEALGGPRFRALLHPFYDYVLLTKKPF